MIDQPTLPVIVATAALQVLDKQTGGIEMDQILMDREDIYSMLRDISRKSCELAYAEGWNAATEAGNVEDLKNPYEGSYWKDQE